MDQILTEQDLNKSWNNISPSLWCLIASRARALLAQRDALRDEVSKNAGSIAALCEANQRMGREVEQAKKEAEFGRAAIEHAKVLGIDANKELGQQYRALRRDAEAWRASRGGGDRGAVQHLGVCFPAGGSPVMIPASVSCDPNRVFDYTAGYLAGKGAK